MVHQHVSRMTRSIILFCFLGVLVLSGCSLFEKKDECSDLTTGGEGCLKRIVSCGTKCFQPGVACSSTNPAWKCTNTTSGSGACECKCL